MYTQQAAHLRLIAGGDDSSLDANLAQALDEGAYTLDVGVLHLLLKLIEPSGNLGLLIPEMGKPMGVDALEGSSLDALGKVGHVGAVLAAYASPEEGVLASVSITTPSRSKRAALGNVIRPVVI